MPAEVSSNLANVYAFLRNTYESTDFLLAPAPTYVQSLAETDSKVVFVYKYDELRGKAMLSDGNFFSSKTTSPDSSAPAKDLDLTGSPLKDDVKLEDLDLSDDGPGLVVLENAWLQKEECYAPIPVEQARSILQEVLNSVGGGIAGSGQLWALCDGKDMDGTLLLQVELNGASRGFVRGAVKLLGYFPEDQLTMAKFQRIHESRAPGLGKDLESSIELWYKIQSHISIKLRWITRSEQPSFCINKKADIILRQAIRVSETQSVAKYFWSQLHLLETIKERIQQIRADPARGPAAVEDEGFAGALDVDVIKDKVQKILTEFYIVEPSADFKLTQIGSIVERVKNRTATDVTDRLWSVLKYCCGYDDLKEVLTFIFKTASRSNLANIPSNSNHLAELIKSIAQRRLAIPILTGSEPMELLLEIGLEKLLKDYQIIFHESKICNLDLANVGKVPSGAGGSNGNDSTNNSRMSSMRKSMYEAVPAGNSGLLAGVGTDDGGAVRNSYFHSGEANLKIGQLTQVQLLLEHLLSIEAHLKLTSIYPQVAEEYFVRPVVSFEEVLARKTDQLEIPILNNKVIELVENSTPYIRRVAMTTRSRFRTVQSTFYQSTEPILPTTQFAQMKVGGEGGEVKNAYWCLEYTKVANH
uniref:Protein zwilch n=1 Tax=Culex tarsalis TaxID=7177 RepID=A0A1Q3G0D1_CULTA